MWTIFDAIFNRAGTLLKNHIESVHDDKKPYQCTICEPSFTESGKECINCLNFLLRFEFEIKEITTTILISL